jgi:rhodanese-related sulfurtransferase
MSWQDLDPHEAHRLLAERPDLRVLDVRTPAEHARHHLDRSLLLPIQELAARVAELATDTPWLVVCEHGLRSRATCAFLAQHGFRELFHLRGGLASWLDERLPVAR